MKLFITKKLDDIKKQERNMSKVSHQKDSIISNNSRRQIFLTSSSATRTALFVLRPLCHVPSPSTGMDRPLFMMIIVVDTSCLLISTPIILMPIIHTTIIIHQRQRNFLNDGMTRQAQVVIHNIRRRAYVQAEQYRSMSRPHVVQQSQHT